MLTVAVLGSGASHIGAFALGMRANAMPTVDDRVDIKIINFHESIERLIVCTLFCISLCESLYEMHVCAILPTDIRGLYADCGVTHRENKLIPVCSFRLLFITI